MNTLLIYAVRDLNLAKNNEAQAKNDRLLAETNVINLMEKKDEGTVTMLVDTYRVSVTYKLKRQLDYQSYLSIVDGLPDDLKCVSLKPEIDIKKLRHLDSVDKLLSEKFITIKPEKPTVKLEIL